MERWISHLGFQWPLAKTLFLGSEMASPGNDSASNAQLDQGESADATPEPAFQEAQKWIEVSLLHIYAHRSKSKHFFRIILIFA